MENTASDIAQELIDVLSRLWDRAQECRQPNWPSYIYGCKDQQRQVGALAFEQIEVEHKLAHLPPMRNREELKAAYSSIVDSLASDLWRKRAVLVNSIRRNTQITHLPLERIGRFSQKELSALPQEIPRQIYQIADNCFPDAGAVFWSAGQGLLLTLTLDGGALLKGVSILTHGKPQQLQALNPKLIRAAGVPNIEKGKTDTGAIDQSGRPYSS